MVSTLVISPQQGIGKSMYGNVLATIIGRANSTVVSTRALRDSFNASFVAKLLVLADEVGIRSSHKDVVADLKAYITDERVHCAAPYAPRLEVENRMTWWMTSNEPHPLVIEEDDRRFTVFLCGHADPHYRDMLRGCFSARTGTYSDSFLAEISGFSHALHKVRIDYSLISRPLSSHAKRELQGVSLGSTIGYVREMQKAGAMAMLSGYPPADPAVYRIQPTDNCVPCAALYHSYRTWCDQHGRRDVAAEGPFRLSVARTPDVSVRTVTTNGQRIRVYSGLPKTDDSSNLIAIS